MSISLSDISVPVFLGGLTSLKNYLDKAAAYVTEKQLDPRALLDARLYPDMFTFTRQVQAATDIARQGIQRISGQETTSVDDTESSIAELVARVEATMAIVKAVERSAIDAMADKPVTLEIGTMKLDFTGRTFVVGFSVPNFMFHVSTAYGLLRHSGIKLGKPDLLGPFIGAVQYA